MSHGIKTTCEIVGETQVVGNVETAAPKQAFVSAECFRVCALPTHRCIARRTRRCDGGAARRRGRLIDSDGIHLFRSVHRSRHHTRDARRSRCRARLISGRRHPATALAESRSPTACTGFRRAARSVLGCGRPGARFAVAPPSRCLDLEAPGAADPVAQALPNDLPRVLFGDDAGRLIGDDRNDEDLIVAQLHSVSQVPQQAIETARLGGHRRARLGCSADRDSS